MKSLLRRSTRLRSTYALLVACRNAARFSPKRVAAGLEADYAGEDPWRYATNPAERQKYAAAREVLEATGTGGVATALEIGCGEGFFTEQIAPCCGQLLAVDLSLTAIDRAAARCAAHPNVAFRQWDLLHDVPLGQFDLVVCMDVLQYVPRPRVRRRAVEKVAGSVGPGGTLLLSGVLRAPHIERAAWGRWLPVGAHADAEWFRTRGRNLAIVGARRTDLHLISVFRALGDTIA
jgi:2-polyprenyl-3-methyl-5-hydroxy-6-metoxy-1,4-benzoquinol methylase